MGKKITIKIPMKKREYTCEFKQQVNVIVNCYDSLTNKLVSVPAININLYCDNELVQTFNYIPRTISVDTLLNKYGYDNKFSFDELEKLNLVGVLNG